MCMEIDDFLRDDSLRTRKSYGRFIKVKGFEDFLRIWEAGVARLPGDDRFTWDDFSYYRGIRNQILKVELNCRIDEATQERILKADTIFRNKTVEVPYGFHHGFRNKEILENPQRYWFYYRAPPERVSEWAIYFEYKE